MSEFERQRCCDEDFGGSHYHCGTCGRVSGMMGCAWKNGRPVCAPDDWTDPSVRGREPGKPDRRKSDRVGRRRDDKRRAALKR